MRKKPTKPTKKAQIIRLVDPSDQDINEVMRLGRENPLPRDQAISLMKKTVLRLREAAEKRGDKKGLASLAGDIDFVAARIVDSVERKRRK